MALANKSAGGSKDDSLLAILIVNKETNVYWPFRLIFCTRLVDSLLPLERLLGLRRFPEFPTACKQKNLASRA